MPLVHPWHEPPYHAPSALNTLDTPRDQRKPGKVATYLKGRFCPKLLQGRKAKELRWITTCLTSESTADYAPNYVNWEAFASPFVAIDILTYDDGIRHFGFEVELVETDKGLLVLVACALQYLHKSGATDPNTNYYTIEDLADNFSFNE